MAKRSPRKSRLSRALGKRQRRRNLAGLKDARERLARSYTRELSRWLSPFSKDVTDTYSAALAELGADATQAARETAMALATQKLELRLATKVATPHVRRIAAKHAAKQGKVVRTIWQQLLGVSLDFLSSPARDAHISRNVALIKSLAGTQLQRAEREVRAGVRAGARHEVIARELRKIAGVTRNRAKLIARDQTTTYVSQVTKEAHLDAGVVEYEWTTAGDGDRVRPEHQELEGLRFSYKDGAPSLSGANPGDEIQCRCFAYPVMTFNV